MKGLLLVIGRLGDAIANLETVLAERDAQISSLQSRIADLETETKQVCG